MKLHWKLLMLFFLIFSYEKASATVQDNIAQINKMAARYKVSAVQMRITAKGESGYRQYNPRTGAHLRGGVGEIGIYQYRKGTFDWFESMFKAEGGRDLSIYNREDQIELTAWAFSKGYQNHWTAFKLAYNRNALPKSFLNSL